MLLAHCHPWKVLQVPAEFKSIDLTECPWIEQQQHRRSESRVLRADAHHSRLARGFPRRVCRTIAAHGVSICTDLYGEEKRSVEVCGVSAVMVSCVGNALSASATERETSLARLRRPTGVWSSAKSAQHQTSPAQRKVAYPGATARLGLQVWSFQGSRRACLLEREGSLAPRYLSRRKRDALHPMLHLEPLNRRASIRAEGQKETCEA
jgi:hypothetical protein